VQAELRRLAGLSPATLTKLRRNQSVSMEVLMKIAEVMDCNIGDMMDFVKAAEN
jgi:DNA-binding Xre family transcriptional regulator